MHHNQYEHQSDTVIKTYSLQKPETRYKQDFYVIIFAWKMKINT